MHLASVQIDVYHGNVQQNVGRVVRNIEALAPSGTDLAIFPECALTGYGAADLEEARRIAASEADLEPIAQAAYRHKMGVVVGTLLKDEDRVVNAAFLFLPDGRKVEYRKTHLPFMGADRFATAGDCLEPIETPWGKLGILVCYDLRFPEASRTLALKGADLIVVPTNWPSGAVVSAEHICIARAAENRVFVATCNRVGDERGFHFIGRSKIIGIDGEVLASAGEGEAIVSAEIDLALAREKRRIVTPGEYETDVFARRTELYTG